MDNSAVYLNECRRMGIKVLPPDVNDSDADFTATGTDIRFGLSAIRNVGENVVDSIIRSRTCKGRFADFHGLLGEDRCEWCATSVSWNHSSKPARSIPLDTRVAA